MKGMSITNPFTPLVNNNIVKKISSLGIFDEKKKKKELKSLGIQFISPFKVNQSIFRELPYMLFNNIVLILPFEPYPFVGFLVGRLVGGLA